MIKILFAMVLGYLFGSIPWALVIGKVFYKTDVRNFGSGNLGGTNAGRVLGKKAGVTVIILDGLKAFFVVWLCVLFVPEAAVYAGMCCCAGHCFPIFAKFKGGKAVATTFGYLLAAGLFVTHEPIQMFVIPFI
ncbi:glycerol-3-phosphate acyltransferase, partial [Phocaeicola vulgatus]